MKPKQTKSVNAGLMVGLMILTALIASLFYTWSHGGLMVQDSEKLPELIQEVYQYNPDNAWNYFNMVTACGFPVPHKTGINAYLGNKKGDRGPLH